MCSLAIRECFEDKRLEIHTLVCRSSMLLVACPVHETAVNSTNLYVGFVIFVSFEGKACCLGVGLLICRRQPWMLANLCGAIQAHLTQAVITAHHGKYHSSSCKWELLLQTMVVFSWYVSREMYCMSRHAMEKIEFGSSPSRQNSL